VTEDKPGEQNGRETHSRRRDIIRRDPYHIIFPPILSRVEGQSRLPRQDFYEPLLRRKLPLEIVRRRGFEVDGDTFPQVSV
jgi:hypothetical protein